MSGITLRNPVANSIPTAITVGRRAVDASSLSLSTGRKVNNDVASSSLGNNLDDRAKVLDKIYGSVGYGSNVVKTVQSGLQNIANTLSEMLGVINSVDSSKVATRTLDAIFQSKFKQIGKQVQSTEFDGRKLLTGELGSDAAVKSKYTTKAVDVRYIGAGAGTLFEGAGAKALKVINVANVINLAPGDEIMLNGVVFKMVKNQDLVTGEGDIPIGATPELTVGSIVTAIRSHSSEALRGYNLTARNSQVMIAQRSASTVDIPLRIKSPAGGMVNASAPSTYSFELWEKASVGDSVNVANENFVYAAGGAGPVTPHTTYVDPGATYADSVRNLRAAMLANPEIKELMNQKLINSIESNSYGLLSVQSKLSKEILGFTTDFSRTIVAMRLQKVTETANNINSIANPGGARVVDPLVIAAARTAITNSAPSSSKATIQAEVQTAIETAGGYVDPDDSQISLNVTRKDPINTISGATTYSRSLTINVVPAVNDTVVLGGVKFRFNPDTALAADEVAVTIGAIGSSMTNVYRAILSHPTTEALIRDNKLSVITDNLGTLTIKSDDDLGLAATGSILPAPGGTILKPIPLSDADVFAIKPAINVSKIRNIEGFIGMPSANFKVIAQASSIGGNGAAGKLYNQITGGLPLPTPSADGDNMVVLQADIAGRAFQSVIWQAPGTTLDNKEIIFTESFTGETFSVNTKALGADISTIENANRTLVKPLATLFSSTEFSQIRDLAIDVSGEKIIDGDGRVIGNVEGMTVSLDSTNFSNKQFEDFTVISDPSGSGEVIFKAIISGKELITKLKVDELKEGAILKLNNEETGDVLVINIGKGGLDSLSEPKNYDYIAAAIKKSLMSIGSGLDVRVGFNADDVSKVKILDISPTKLYLNNEGEYISKLDLLTTANVGVARQVITNALELVRTAQASTQGQGEMVSGSAKLLKSTLGITKDASDRYLDTDLVEAASTFAAALKSLLAGTATYQSGERVAAAGLEIIKTTAVAN